MKAVRPSSEEWMIDASAPRTCRAAPRAFTLVELLVVMGIIAVLTAILLTVVAKVSHIRDVTACAANLRSVGVAVWSFAMDESGDLPEHHHVPGIDFDTTMMREDEGENYVNLGQLLGYISRPESLYCPSHDADDTPELAFDSKANPFRNGAFASRNHDEHPGQGKGLNNHPYNPPVGVNSSYPARSLLDPGPRPVAWAVRNFGNRVIYSDFVGVDGWEGRGRWSGHVHAPHDSVGYNRLFGDGAVHWADAQPLNDFRPIDEREPNGDLLRIYYELLDVLP